MTQWFGIVLFSCETGQCHQSNWGLLEKSQISRVASLGGIIMGVKFLLLIPRDQEIPLDLHSTLTIMEEEEPLISQRTVTAKVLHNFIPWR